MKLLCVVIKKIVDTIHTAEIFSFTLNTTLSFHRLTIVRKIDAGDGSYPSVNTCVHYLKVSFKVRVVGFHFSLLT